MTKQPKKRAPQIMLTPAADVKDKLEELEARGYEGINGPA